MRLDTLSGVEINMRVILVNSPPEVCMACCLITGGSFAEGRMTKKHGNCECSCRCRIAGVGYSALTHRRYRIEQEMSRTTIVIF